MASNLFVYDSLMIRGFLFSFAVNPSIEDVDAFIKSELHPRFEFVEQKMKMSVYRVDKVINESMK